MDASTATGRPTALITGAAGGIGLATAQLLHAQGWQVVATAQPGQATEALQPVAEIVEVDLSDDGSRGRLIAHALNLPRLDALVSNAGVAIPGPVEGVALADLRLQFEVNTIAPMDLTRALLPQLRDSRGRLVFVGAGQGRVALAFGGPYGASKAALASLTDSLRAEVADSGVLVSLIEPGAIRTGILDDSRRRALDLLDRMPRSMAERYRSRMLATFESSERAFRAAPPPETVARLIADILASPAPRPRYLLGREAYGLAAVALLPARLRASLIGRLARPQR